MAEAAQKALYRAISGVLRNATTALDRVYVQYVPENKQRPYFLIGEPVGGERNFHTRVQDPEFVVAIKAVSLDLGEALDLMQAGKELLDDQGEQDLAGVSGGTDWSIHKMMVEGLISQTYKVGTSRIFEEGFQVRVIMQEK